jgi:hypothetical protein
MAAEDLSVVQVKLSGGNPGGRVEPLGSERLPPPSSTKAYTGLITCQSKAIKYRHGAPQYRRCCDCE